MIKSMTAYAEKTVATEHLTVACEIRTYNSRYLDIIPRIPAIYRSYENDLKQHIAGRIQRGRVEIGLTTAAGDAEDRCRFVVDPARADSYYQALSQLQERFGWKDVITLEMVARAEGVIRSEEFQASGEDDWPLIAEAVDGALTGIEEMRRQEGRVLAEDLMARLDVIQATVAYIKARSEGLTEDIYRRLQERITALTRDMVELDPARIAQEAALYADRADISEEIVRAESHVVQFKSAMASEEPCGRKLNFLLQEFNREFNTMGSKTGNPEISEKVVAVKTELEKIREQVQNIE